MSKKSVHFREENAVSLNADDRSPSPPGTTFLPHTPSPSFSVATLSPNSSPLTPSPLVYHSPTFSDKHGLPNSVSSEADVLHVELSHDTQITFDFNYSPFHANNDLNITVPIASLEAPATNAPIMMISCHLLPWVIEISPRRDEAHITVLDVLIGIYHALQRHATDVELLSEPLPMQRQIEARRTRRLLGKEMIGKEDKSFKRIDWLPEGKRLFLGLSELPSVNGVRRWCLKVDECGSPLTLGISAPRHIPLLDTLCERYSNIKLYQ